MAQQWVDITTVNNTTPITAVRWQRTYHNDLMFSETSGLSLDGMSWYECGGSAYGYASIHRWNGDVYCCTFNKNYIRNCGEGEDFDDCGCNGQLPCQPIMHTVIHDANPDASGYYDSAVTISGQTFYEVDWTLWDNYTPLYFPYTGSTIEAGRIYVLAGLSAIYGNKNAVGFKASGGTDSTLEITADDNWTASTTDNWFTVSALSGTSGTTTITITAPDYQGSTARTGTITFECNGDTFVVTVRQSKYIVPGQGTGCYFIGTDVEDFYLGDTHVDALYLGGTQIS